MSPERHGFRITLQNDLENSRKGRGYCFQFRAYTFIYQWSVQADEQKSLCGWWRSIIRRPHGLHPPARSEQQWTSSYSMMSAANHSKIKKMWWTEHCGVTAVTEVVTLVPHKLPTHYLWCIWTPVLHWNAFATILCDIRDFIYLSEAKRQWSNFYCDKSYGNSGVIFGVAFSCCSCLSQ